MAKLASPSSFDLGISSRSISFYSILYFIVLPFSLCECLTFSHLCFQAFLNFKKVECLHEITKISMDKATKQTVQSNES